MTASIALLLVHALATVFMTGLIWFVQIVHYPLMALVGAGGPDNFTAYESRHMERTSWIVGPTMLIEASAAAALLFFPPPGRIELAVIGALLLAIVWISTAMLQVPRHRALRTRFDERIVRSLVATNWIRTAAWSARAVIALILLVDPAAAS